MSTANTTSKVIGYLQGTTTLSVKANGGTVLVEILHDSASDTWVVADTISEDGAYPLRIGFSKVRITPTGGATWAVR